MTISLMSMKAFEPTFEIDAGGKECCYCVQSHHYSAAMQPWSVY